MATLKRTQMYFPDEVLNQLKKVAEKNNTTVSDVVRKAVLTVLNKEQEKNWEKDPLWDMVGAIKSDENLSVNHDTYLYKENI